MRESYIERIQKLSEKLSDSDLAVRARKMNSHTFSRNRKMSLKDILLCCFSKKGLLLQLLVKGIAELSYRECASKGSEMIGQSISAMGVWNVIQALGEATEKKPILRTGRLPS